MGFAALLLACTSLPLSVATAPPFPRLYNIEGGQDQSVETYCADGLKVLAGGCSARGDPWYYSFCYSDNEDRWILGGTAGTKRIRMTCVDPEYAPTREWNNAHVNGFVTATCKAGQKIIGGGCWTQDNSYVSDDIPEGNNGWRCGSQGLSQVTAHALCIDDSVETVIKESSGGDPLTVSCDAGQQAVSGGCQVTSGDGKMANSWPTLDRTGWFCEGFGYSKTVKAICVRTTTSTTTPTPYRYYRFTMKQVHRTKTHFAELELGLATTKVTQPGVTAYSLGAEFAIDSGNGALKAIDGDYNSKYYDSFCAPLVVDFQSAVAADSFRFVTAWDFPEDDPVRWFFEGSADSKEWVRLHEETGVDTKSRSRSSQTEWFDFVTGEVTYRFFRFSPLKRNFGDPFQIADFKFRVGGSEVSLAGVSASSPAAPWGVCCVASNLLDNNADTKFLTDHAANTEITFDFGSNIGLEEFGIVTGDDYPERDPKKWLMEGSTDLSTWELLNQQLLTRELTNELAGRKTFVGWFPMRKQDFLPVIVLAENFNGCPLNYGPLTRDECELSVSAAGMPLLIKPQEIEWHVSNTADPRACFHTKTAWFNAHPSAPGGRETRWNVCKGTTTSTTTTSTITTTTYTTTTTTTTTTNTRSTLYSLMSRLTNASFIPRANKVNDTCSSTKVWRISIVSGGAPKVVTLEVHMGDAQGWKFLGHIGRGLVITDFGGPSFTWRLVSLGNDVYKVQNVVTTNTGKSYLALNNTDPELASSGENEGARWVIEGLP